MNPSYVKGFMFKCESLGLDPETLLKSAAKLPVSLSGRLLRPVEQEAPSLFRRLGGSVARHPWIAAGAGAAGALGVEGLGHYFANDAPLPAAEHDAQLTGHGNPGPLQLKRLAIDPSIKAPGKKAPVPKSEFMSPYKGPLDTDRDSRIPQIGRDPEGNPI